MLPNLILNAGTNMVNISQKVTSNITISSSSSGTSINSYPFNTLTINLNNPNNSVLLSGVVDTTITGAASNNPNVLLQIRRAIKGVDTVIYQGSFTPINTTPITNQFALQWLDSSIALDSCPNMCSEYLNKCPVNTITYSFYLAIANAATAPPTTVTATIPEDSYYSLTAIEIPQ